MKTKQIIVISRTGKETGVMTGETESCSLEGCRGQEHEVKWKSGKNTWVCGKGLDWLTDTKAKII